MTKTDPFKGFHSSPEIIRLTVMMYVRFPLSLRNVEDLLHIARMEASTGRAAALGQPLDGRFGPLATLVGE